MAKHTFASVDSVAFLIKKFYGEVNGKAKLLKKLYVGDENGIARLIHDANSLSSIKTWGDIEAAEVTWAKIHEQELTWAHFGDNES